MSPDALSVAVRTLAFALLLQATGAALFTALFAPRLAATAPAIRRLALASALAGEIALAVHRALDAARMAGDYSGLADPALQGIAWTTSSAAACGMQALGLLLVAASALRVQSAKPGRRAALGVVGAAIAIGGFLFTGHTRAHAWRAVLAPLLALHLLLVAFWFGALVPLLLVMRRESPAGATAVLREFSALAGWLVPLIAVAGMAMALLLVGGLPAPSASYGALLLAKLAGFALLMILAACNKWRWLPALAAGAVTSRVQLQRSLRAEFALIIGVLGATAALTSLYSP